MAEEKKPEKKDVAPAPVHDPFVEIVSMLVVLFIGLYVLNALFSFIGSQKILSRGWSGFTPQGIMLAHTRPISSLANPLNSRVASTRETSVYSDPGDKKSIGTQSFGTRGKIIKGPIEINGVRYWYVDYDTGPDGWVKESDIAYVESEPTVFERVLLGLFSALTVIRIIAFIISFIFILWLIYLVRGIIKIRTNERKLLYPEVMVESPGIINPQWERVLAHVESQNDSDWRLGVLEADIMLDDLLDKLGLPGETMGDKLKAVEKSDFRTIDNAWEAHKVRNQIAHEGAEFGLTQREARRVIELYRTIFEEFEIIS